MVKNLRTNHWEMDALSVKCGLLTDKSAKIGSLSVNLCEILADCPKNKKYVPSQHVFLSLFSCVRAHDRSLPHLVLIGFRLTFPLSQARSPWTRQARLRSSKACVRGHKRSASHLVLSSFILTKSFVKMPATFFSISFFASFSSSIVQMR